MDLDVVVLAGQVATILSPYLLKGAGKAAETFGEKIAEGLWDRLRGSKKKDDLEKAAQPKNGQIDQAALADAIHEALEADTSLRQAVQQVVEVHGHVIYGNYNQTRDIKESVVAIGGGQVVQHITHNYGEWQSDLKGKLTAPVLPPRPYYAHPYGGGDFVGREEELGKLDAWAAEAGKPVMAWIAIGGMGKSALTWEWRRAHVEDYAGVMWWSFYEATFQEFLDRALAYFGRGEIDPADYQGGDKIVKLVDLLDGPEPTLLVMDGFERELRAYAGLNAAYQGDLPDTDQPPIGDPRLECVDPQAHNFLQAVGARRGLTSKVLLTSRLYPNALADRYDAPLDAVRHEHLTGLQPADAVALFRELGVQGTHTEIEAACARLGYHPLSLRLLAGYVVGFEQEERGDIRAAPGYEDLEDELVMRKTHILETAYGALQPERQQFLGRLAAFRSAMDYPAVTRVMERPEGTDAASPLSAQEKQALNETLKDLMRRGLVFRDEAGPYDLHPIVRRYAYERLTDRVRADTHARLRDYFEALPESRPDKVERLEDLEPVIELYHHTLNAGDNDAARELYRDRLRDSLYYQLGAYQTIIELLGPLFADGEDQPPRLTSVSAQAWTASHLGSTYGRAGQPTDAVPLFKVHNSICEQLDDKGNLAVGLGNLAIDQMNVGALGEAAANLWRSIALGEELGDEGSEAADRTELGRALAYAGAYDEAAQELDKAKALSDRAYERSAYNGPVLARAYRAETYLFRGEAKAALAAVQRAQHRWERHARDRYPLERDFVRNAWLLGAARRGLGELDVAEGHLSEALARCRRINMVDHEAVIMLELAHTRRDQERGDEALELTEEALVIAERSGYRLQQADIHYLLALLARDAGDTEKAREHAEQARDYAWCDGPEYAYRRTWEAAEGLLGALGA